MRLIDADALEKEFCSGCQYENNKYSNCIDCALAQAPTIEEHKWIPCSERLPKNHENVLVCGVEALNNVHIYSVKCWDVDEWRPVSAPSCTWEAWMPIPEPYKERREE